MKASIVGTSLAIVSLILNVTLLGAQAPNQKELIASWLYRDLNVTRVNADGQTVTKMVSAEDAKKTEICLEEYRTKHSNNNRHNFTLLLEIAGKCLVQNAFQMKLAWTSIDGNREELRLRKYRRFVITMKPSVPSYSTHETEAPKPKTIISKWIHNFFTDLPIDSVIKESVTEEETTAVSVSKAWEASVTTKVSLTVGPVEASAEFSIGGRGEDKTSKETTTIKTYNLEDTIGVDPNTSVKVIWTMYEQQLEASWSAYMIFSGYIAVGLDVSGTVEIWFLPLADMEKFIAGFLQRPEEPGALYVPISGRIQGNRGVQSVTRAYSMPLIRFESDDSMIGKCEANIADMGQYDEVLSNDYF